MNRKKLSSASIRRLHLLQAPKENVLKQDSKKHLLTKLTIGMTAFSRRQ